MKKLVLVSTFYLMVAVAFTAPFKFLPYTIYQPDGTKIECFTSGDEYFNWLHDADGYSIIKGKDRYYYYAEKVDGKIVASEYRVNSISPAAKGLEKWIRISKDEYMKKKKAYDIPSSNQKNVKAPHTGTMNNIVIYIRFADEDEIATTRETYDTKLNGETGESLRDYYDEVSYNQLDIASTHFPACSEPTTTNASYQDSHERSYFQVYDADLNPNGYDGDTERREREHQLLVDAIEWVNANDPIPSDLDIDGDNDGYVDNICFMINGVSDEWADLLWAHRWALWTYDAEINGKGVWDYTFQPENQVSVRTLCHEMFHALGAPDLYHYDDGDLGLDPVGYWDIMEHGPGHMGAYMKWKYAEGNWISEIPEINAGGTYTLNPLVESTNNCYKIASPNSINEFFVVEYRKKIGEFEGNLPGNGLLVYRINTDFDGNAGFDGVSVFDEVYIYRPGGTPTISGNVDNANFSETVNRTEINDETDPSSFLHDGTPGGLSIQNVSAAGETITFDVLFDFVTDPGNVAFDPVSETEIELTWEKNSARDQVLLATSVDGVFGTPQDGSTYSVNDEIAGGGTVLAIGGETTYTHSGLEIGTVYYYKVWSVTAESKYSEGVEFSAYTQCGELVLPYSQDFSYKALPACWLNSDKISSGAIWEFNNPAGRDFGSTTAENGFAILDSENYGSGISQNADLVTPSFDFSALNGVQVSFEHYFKSWVDNIAKFSYSIDGGSTWENIKTWTTNAGSASSPQEYEIILTDEIAGKEDVQFAWNYNGSYGYYWIIDDFELSTDTLKPTAAITSEYADTVREKTFEINIVFDETVSDFTMEDILIENGVVDTMYSETDSLFTAEVTANVPGEVIISVDAEVAFDSFNNGNIASNDYIINYAWPLSINEFSTTKIRFYPNPANGVLFISGLNDAFTSDVRLYNLAGQLVYSETFKQNVQKIQLPIEEEGLYFLQVINGSEITNSQLIIK